MRRKRWRVAHATMVLALVGGLALALPAAEAQKKKKPKVKTKVIETGIGGIGGTAAVIPDGGANGVQQLVRSRAQTDFPDNAKVKDVDVGIRLSHPRARDVEAYIASPRGVIALVSNLGRGGDNFGLAPDSCAGFFTTFDSQAPFSIFAGTPPFATSFQPQESLSVLKGLPGDQASLPWTLLVLDDESMFTGALWCWSLTVRYTVPAK